LKGWDVTFPGAPELFRDGFDMKKIAIVAVLVTLSGCSTLGTASGTVGGAASSVMGAVTGIFGG